MVNQVFCQKGFFKSLPRLLSYSWQNKFWYEVNHFVYDFGEHSIINNVLRNQYVNVGKDPNCQVSLELIQFICETIFRNITFWCRQAFNGIKIIGISF